MTSRSKRRLRKRNLVSCLWSREKQRRNRKFQKLHPKSSSRSRHRLQKEKSRSMKILVRQSQRSLQPRSPYLGSRKTSLMS